MSGTDKRKTEAISTSSGKDQTIRRLRVGDSAILHSSSQSYKRKGVMDNKTIRIHMNNLIQTGLLLALAACSSGSSGGPDCRFNEAWVNGQCTVEFIIPPITIPDGIWRGVDSGGRDVVAFVNRFSSFQFVDGFENQGSGFLAVGTGDVVDSNFRLVTQRGATFADGTTAADCTFSGSLIERQTLTVTEICMTSAGLQFQEILILTFDALYDRDSSLAIIAGMYETPTGNVLSIASDGTIFVQDAVSGCVTNGQVSVAVSFTNMYFYAYGIDNCNGPDAIWNGSSFSGLAVLDNTFSPESLTVAVIGEVGGVAISLVVENERL